MVQADVSAFIVVYEVSLSTVWIFPAKKQETTQMRRDARYCERVSGWFAPLKAVLGRVTVLIKHYEVLVESIVSALELIPSLAAI
jgi:hypothetical protein